MLNT